MYDDAIAKLEFGFEEASAFYQKAFEIREQFQAWCKVSSTLSQWSNLLEIQENWAEALQIYIHAFAIDLEHNEEWIGWVYQKFRANAQGDGNVSV
jgi:tetratricopeptide (TPR) repeat protein